MRRRLFRRAPAMSVFALLAAALLAGTARTQDGGVEEIVERDDGSFLVTLLWLGDFELEMPRWNDPEMAEKMNAQIPERILALDGKRVEITGFAMPMEFGGAGSVTRMLLLADLMGCCFGIMPAFNEMVEVVIPEPGEKGVVNAEAYSVTGTIRVGAENNDWGYVTNLYRIEAEEIRENRDFARSHGARPNHGW